ncbi:hypothetical protein [Enterobacter hormaechei]|uniref:hypothetical protein n=1 Tax=Enterobacter hormaechei TaxID=158836 RepID=UPI000DA22062|nr:hypothetical protein [Enterobacter hormaechei]
MSTLTKEWLLKTIAELEEERNATAGAVNEDATMALEAMKLALASLEAEAMTQVLSSRAGNDTSTIDKAMPEGTMLYTAPPAPVSVPDVVSWEDVPEEITEDDIALASAWAHGFNQCRAAMLQGAEPVSQPYTLPDGYCIMPMKLTAENGAKCALAGEFSETKFISCPECFGDDECETCDGTGRIEISVPVSWTTIKDIWAKGVEHFAEAAPQQEVKP